MIKDNAIEANGLTKSYGKVKAVDGVSFDVRRGEIFGLIGPDGAGKTSIFRMLTTLMDPDKGSASVDCLDILKEYKQIRRRVGYMPGHFSLYPDLTVEENLEFFATLFGVTVEESYPLIAPIYSQIEPFKTRRAGKLSGGMKQKLALSCALVHKPSVLFLDEPTTGVDAVSRKEFWDMLASLKEKGISILVSTPYMDEARLCDRIALITHGRILGIDTPEGIVSSFDAPLYAVSASGMYGLLKAARSCEGVTDCYTSGAAHHLVASKGFDEVVFVNMMKDKGFHDLRIERVQPGIEDVFIRLDK